MIRYFLIVSEYYCIIQILKKQVFLKEKIEKIASDSEKMNFFFVGLIF